MKAIPQKYLLALFFFAIPLFFINIHDGHSWGDDFALYIKEAQNIAHIKPYYLSDNIFNKYNTVYSPPQYPPGFPLLLAPVVKIWGLSFRAMYYYNSIIVTCLLFALFLYFRKKSIDHLSSLCLSVLITYSFYVLDLKGAVLADIPCMLFITLYLAYRESETYSWRRILLLVFFAVMAIQIRSQAIFILAAEALFLFAFFIKTSVQEKRFAIRSVLVPPSLLVVGGVLIINLLLDKVIFATPLNTTAFYNNFIQAVFQGSLIISAKDNAYYLLKTISTYFSYTNTNGFLNAAAYWVGCAGLTFGFLGFIISIIKHLAFDDFFFFIMCVLIILYPVHDARYFLPAMPILYYYCYTTFSFIIPAISVHKARVMIIFTLAYLVLGVSYIKKITFETPIGMVPQPNDLEAFRYIARHVDYNDVIVFAKPRALSLFTGKKTICVAWQVSDEMNKKVFDSVHVRYMLVLHGYEDNFFKLYLSQIQHPVDSVNIAQGYTLYALH